MSARVRRFPLGVLVLVLTTACAEQRLKSAEARLEALHKERAERAAREVDPLRAQLPTLKGRIEASERSRAHSQRELSTLRERLVKSWDGQDEKLESLASASGLPAELYPALKSAQQALGEQLRPKQIPPKPDEGEESEEAESPDTPDHRLLTALQSNDMSAVAEALVEWNLKSVEAPPAEEEPKEAPAACDKPNEGQARCEIQPGKGAAGSGFVLCQIEKVKQWWALSSDGQKVWMNPLEPAPSGRHQWVRPSPPRCSCWRTRAPSPGRSDAGSMPMG
jgi:hypothetical protein